MAKALPLHVLVEQADPVFTERISTLLREEHGAHGLRIIGGAALVEDPTIQPDLTVSTDQDGTVSINYDRGVEAVHEPLDGQADDLERAISRFALGRLGIPLERQSSRSDTAALEEYIGERPNLDADPSTWIVNNPFLADLCRRFPEYGNLVRYLCNERGLFLKVGNYSAQRAYWNSTLNGGLPVFKKADPIHEGTFMLHDMFHFVPIDPILGSETLNGGHKAAYIAHRLLSEASTLVLADMVAVADANLVAKGYDVSKRRIFPVYQSMLDAKGKAPDIDKLLAANAHFCFTGDGEGFRSLGASNAVLDEFKSKYEAIFRDDFMWNIQNYDAMLAERESNPDVGRYYEWLEAQALFPKIGEYGQVIDDRAGIDIARMLSLFRADFSNALNYRQPLSDVKRTKLTYQKYLAGQKIVLARFNNALDTTPYAGKFDELYASLHTAADVESISQLGTEAADVIDDYTTRLEEDGILLPHQATMYRFAAPLYPVKFVNYERAASIQGRSLSEIMREFLTVNRGNLNRLLDIVTA